MMDPLGFALENFDGVGRWRALDESGAPIDASGTSAKSIETRPGTVVVYVIAA